MSNIYIQEPPTSGKVLMKTTAGDIDIELWSRECPKACRNFIQLCMEGYYNGTIFHRVVKGFIVQGGDPNGDGTGGESIYGKPFKDEFHSRLRFARRGLIGMANADKDDNGSQFFFTMGATPELQNKNTLFAKVTGNTLYNMLKLEEGLVDHNERPMYPQKILRTEILSNPFEDIVPRKLAKEEKKEKTKKREKGVKNFGLLSFGAEAEEDEEETNEFVQKNAGKAKSMHDVVDDPKLSKEVVRLESTHLSADDDGALEVERRLSHIKKEDIEEDDLEEKRQRIKNKLKRLDDNEKLIKKEPAVIQKEQSDSDEDMLMTQEQERKIKSDKKKDEIRQEIINLKKQYQTEKRQRENVNDIKPEKNSNSELEASAEGNEFIKNFIEEKEKYGSLKSKIPKKGASREDFTLSLLAKFRQKLDTLKQKQADSNELPETLDDGTIEKEIHSDDWLAHTLKFEEPVPVLAKDASTKSDDWYDAYDPRNPLNKRKRGEGSKALGGSSRDGSNIKRRK
ncbi:spliceosome-associated protein CWC27 homolog [Eurosta solidaginis]|uniref:spliceosome-associated protein CWC27 homolog n=1 Tax=Eurosta solidaginis TaxID=178769 RepID=UPI003530DE50